MWMWLTILWGCGPPTSIHLPAPLLLHTSALLPGRPLELRIEGLAPGSQVQLASSWAPPGPGPCPDTLRGACWELLPSLVDVAVADPGGVARLLHAPAEPWGEALRLQAAELGPSAFPARVRLSGIVERSPLRSLPLLDGDLIVASPDDLDRLDGIYGIGGDLIVTQTALTELVLPELIEIGGDVQIWENPVLHTLRLPGLERIGGDLNLYDDPVLVRPGLGSLEQIGGALRIHRMPGLADLGGLGALRHIGELYLYRDDGLISLSGLEALASVDGGIELMELSALQQAVLPSLEHVGGRLYVLIAPSMVRLEAPALTSLRGLEIHAADALPSPGLFPGITRLGGELRLEYNGAMASLAGLSALEQVHSATLRFNPSLATLADASAWHTVDEELILGSNQALERLDLPALQQAGRLEITRNGALIDPGLSALSALEQAEFSDNPALSSCALEAWLDRVQPDQVACIGNLDDGCTGWCDPTGGP
ncbi:MAG TPA: hypothetical protein ENK18_16745 [Deltaproteobacteria bacterium]|nr:hypothetical protein [Deltaproteobacteria bacterium]